MSSVFIIDGCSLICSPREQKTHIIKHSDGLKNREYESVLRKWEFGGEEKPPVGNWFHIRHTLRMNIAHNWDVLGFFICEENRYIRNDTLEVGPLEVAKGIIKRTVTTSKNYGNTEWRSRLLTMSKRKKFTDFAHWLFSWFRYLLFYSHFQNTVLNIIWLVVKLIELRNGDGPMNQCTNNWKILRRMRMWMSMKISVSMGGFATSKMAKRTIW